MVPAHNEARGIAHALDVIVNTLTSCGMNLEIIVVDDGSRDDTFERVRELSRKDARIKGLRFTRNFGKEAALLAGLRVAAGEAVVTIDSDLQHPPALIPKMIKEWRNGAMVVDAVKQSRENDGSLPGCAPRCSIPCCLDLGGINLENASDFKLLDRVVVDAITRGLLNASASTAGWPTGSDTVTRAYPSTSRHELKDKVNGRCGNWSGWRPRRSYPSPARRCRSSPSWEYSPSASGLSWVPTP